MRGNTYIIIPQDKATLQIPQKLANRLGWDEVEYDEEGNEIKRTRKHPTWEELGLRYKRNFGDIRTVERGRGAGGDKAAKSRQEGFSDPQPVRSTGLAGRRGYRHLKLEPGCTFALS